MKATTVLISYLLLAIACADENILRNPDFEIPPSNLPGKSTDPLVTLNETTNVIPGWTFEGTVQYVTAGKTISLPGNGHAIQLGQDGKINQTFAAVGDDALQYLLTFTLSLAGDTPNCSANTSLVVSAPDSDSEFSLKRKYGKEMWESYGHYLGSWSGEGEVPLPINLVFQSQATDADSNSTCWPIIDKLLIKTVGSLNKSGDNLLLNGGFEVGPDFLENSSEGILLDSEPSPVRSALQQWSVLGTVKYLDSKHYFVPEGNAAVEIVSGVAAGVQTAMQLTDGSSYNLEFMLGDANDSCVGEFIVGVQAGSTAQNFTLMSNGTGLAKKFSMAFQAASSSSPISFQSYTTNSNKDGIFCGPVVDDVILRASGGLKLAPQFIYILALLHLVALLNWHA